MTKKVYIIANGKNYIGQKLGNVVNDISKAKQYDKLDDVNKAYTNCVSKQLKNLGFKVEQVEVEDNSSERINPLYTSVDINKLKEGINELSNEFSLLKGNKEWLLDEESNIDKQISDILHYIEFYTFSASDGYKLCKALKELRLRRREIKNELELINIINVHTCNNIANGNTSKAIEGLSNKQYAPRVLNDLFVSRNINSLLESGDAD